MASCKSCGESLQFFRTVNGGWMPVNVRPGMSTTTITPQGEVQRHREPVRGFIPHWITCPDAKRFRKKIKRRKS